MDRVVLVEQINEILEIKDSYQAPEALLNILYSGKEKREDVFMKFLQLWGNDVSGDRFHEYFEQEHADRKVKKQDYTPTSIAKLLSNRTFGVSPLRRSLLRCAATLAPNSSKENGFTI